MSINLTAIFSHPSAINNKISYARIDNTTTPVFVQAGNFITSPAIIATNIPAGQYQVNITPIYADGRVCDPTTFQTPACPGLNSISGYIQSGNLVVQYNAPATVPKVRITVTFPNGGSNVQNYVNTGANIVVPLPSGLFGDYTIQGQSVCDETSAFYSSLSSTVVVSLNQPVAGTFALSIAPSGICGATPGTFYTNGPFAVGDTLYSDLGLSIPVTGFNYVVYNNTVYAIGGTTGLIGAATGNTCNANISGTTGLSSGIPTSSGLITAPPGTVVHVVLSAGGPTGGTYTVNFNIPSIATFNVTNGTNTNTFTMPPSGSVAWNANYTASNSSGSGSISVY